MTNEDFAEFYNRNYRPMPDDFYPEIVSDIDPESGNPCRRIGTFAYFIEEDSLIERAGGDLALRALEWNRLEMARISKLAGIGMPPLAIGCHGQ